MLRFVIKIMQRPVSLSLLAVLPLAMTGCQAVTSSGTQSAQLRIIDASIDAGGLDVYANNSIVTYNLGFGSITSYVPVTPNTYTLTADQANTKTALATAKATLSAGKQSTLLIGNVLADLQATVLTDQSTPAPSGQIDIRIIDQATKVGSVDIYLVPSTATLLTTNPLLTSVAFGTNTGYLNVPVGTYTLYVMAAGTVISSTTVGLYTGDSVTYPQGCARTIVLLDQQVTTTPSVQVITANDYDLATASS